MMRATKTNQTRPGDRHPAAGCSNVTAAAIKARAVVGADVYASATRDFIRPFVYRRYDYRLKIVLRGRGTGLETLRITHDIQHSQRALPALGQGPNRIRFSAGSKYQTST